MKKHILPIVTGHKNIFIHWMDANSFYSIIMTSVSFFTSFSEKKKKTILDQQIIIKGAKSLQELTQTKR